MHIVRGVADTRYVNHTHGLDGIGHLNKRLTETEAKGSKNDQVRVSYIQGIVTRALRQTIAKERR